MRVDIIFSGEIPDTKPKLPKHIYVLADDACEALKEKLAELGVTGAAFDIKVIKPKAAKPAVDPAPAPRLVTEMEAMTETPSDNPDSDAPHAERKRPRSAA